MRWRPALRAAVAAAAALATVAACAQGARSTPTPSSSAASATPSAAPSGLPSTPGSVGPSGPGLPSATATAAPSATALPSTGPNTKPTLAAGPATAAPTAALRPFYSQRVAWAACGLLEPGAQCARITVPLDYAKVSRGTISLAIVRVPATGGGAKLGSIVVNPGGPGGSGLQYALAAQQIIDPAVRARYDIVGFDPRGVGQSSPVTCLPTAGLDAFVNADPVPTTKAGIAQLDTQGKAMAQACAANSPRLLPYLGTNQSARDLDVVRALLGEQRLNLLGKSYGTYLGAVYAGLFPSRVGRFVLDGGVDPASTPDESNLSQAAGFQTALTALLTSWVGGGNCPLGSTVAAAQTRLTALLQATRQHPVPTGQPRQLLSGEAFTAVFYALYSPQRWPQLETALTQLLNGEGAGMLALSDAYNGRGPGGYVDNSIAAFYATICLDRPYADTDAQIAALLPRFHRVSPVFGAALAWGSIACRYWHVKPAPTADPIHAVGTPPILVVGTTRDPATPYAETKALASELDSGVFLGRVGDGHTAYLEGNTCVDAHVDAFFLTGVTPADGAVCAATGGGQTSGAAT